MNGQGRLRHVKTKWQADDFLSAFMRDNQIGSSHLGNRQIDDFVRKTANGRGNNVIFIIAFQPGQNENHVVFIGNSLLDGIGHGFNCMRRVIFGMIIKLKVGKIFNQLAYNPGKMSGFGRVIIKIGINQSGFARALFGHLQQIDVSGQAEQNIVHRGLLGQRRRKFQQGNNFAGSNIAVRRHGV